MIEARAVRDELGAIREVPKMDSHDKFIDDQMLDKQRTQKGFIINSQFYGKGVEKRLLLICPPDLRVSLNSTIEGLGFGPNFFSCRLYQEGQVARGPAFYCCHGVFWEGVASALNTIVALIPVEKQAQIIEIDENEEMPNVFKALGFVTD